MGIAIKAARLPKSQSIVTERLRKCAPPVDILAPGDLENDSWFEARPVGRSADGITADEHDAVLYRS